MKQLILKYLVGGYLEIKDDANYWNKYIDNNQYKPIYNENDGTWNDYYNQYSNNFYSNLLKNFQGQVDKATLIQNPLIRLSMRRNFNNWWKKQNFGAIVPEDMFGREIPIIGMSPKEMAIRNNLGNKGIYLLDESKIGAFIRNSAFNSMLGSIIPVGPSNMFGSIIGALLTNTDKKFTGDDDDYHLNSRILYRSGYNGSTGKWIQNDQIFLKLIHNKSKESKLNPNLHKKGGIIKAALGWRINNNRLIVTHNGTDFFVDPESFSVDNEGVSNAAYYDSKGTKHYFRLTIHDINRLKQLGVNYKKGKVIASTYNPNNSSNSSTDESAVSPPAQVTSPVLSSQQGFTPELFFDTLFGNQEYAKKFKLFLGIPDVSTETKPAETETESETTKAEVTTPTIDPYLKIIKMNQLAFKNGKGSSRFNRDFRQAFTTALASGDLYNKETGLGSQVFDLGGDWTAEKMLGYITPGKGLTRKGMRRMIKDYNSPSAESINNGINRFFGFNPNASPAQSNLSVINGLEPVVATINGQVANNVNSFGFDKANYYPNILNGFNGTSDIDPNAAYRAELEKRNAINLLNRS